MITYNGDIDWLLNSANSALGERSVQAQFQSAMERMSVSAGGLPNTDLYNENQLGVYFDPKDGSVARARNLTRVWRAVPQWAQAVLMARYVFNPMPMLGTRKVAERLWHALDPKIDPEVDRAVLNQKRHLKEKDPEQPNTRPWQLGGLLVFISWRVGTLPKLTTWFDRDSNEGYPRRYLKACNRISEAAHRAWSKAYRANMPSMRQFVAQHEELGATKG